MPAPWACRCAPRKEKELSRKRWALSLSSATLCHSINLWEMAEFLLKQDVVNAINLDGGGSATFVLNGTLASYPSDHW